MKKPLNKPVYWACRWKDTSSTYQLRMTKQKWRTDLEALREAFGFSGPGMGVCRLTGALASSKVAFKKLTLDSFYPPSRLGLLTLTHEA